MFVRLAGWMALLARSSASKDAELLVLRRGRNLRPPDGGDNITAPVSDLTAAARIRHRTVLGGLIREYERAA